MFFVLQVTQQNYRKLQAQHKYLRTKSVPAMDFSQSVCLGNESFMTARLWASYYWFGQKCRGLIVEDEAFPVDVASNLGPHFLATVSLSIQDPRNMRELYQIIFNCRSKFGGFNFQCLKDPRKEILNLPNLTSFYHLYGLYQHVSTIQMGGLWHSSPQTC